MGLVPTPNSKKTSLNLIYKLFQNDYALFSESTG